MPEKFERVTAADLRRGDRCASYKADLEGPVSAGLGGVRVIAVDAATKGADRVRFCITAGLGQEHWITAGATTRFWRVAR